MGLKESAGWLGGGGVRGEFGGGGLMTRHEWCMVNMGRSSIKYSDDLFF